MTRPLRYANAYCFAGAPRGGGAGRGEERRGVVVGGSASRRRKGFIGRREAEGVGENGRGSRGKFELGEG